MGVSICPLRYRPGLPLVLKGLHADIQPRQKVGVVGRTGAGKSSLINSLFRLVELSDGAIVIDGIGISNIGIRQLRSRMAIIPQVPVMFTGTVRSNLDPFNEHTDAEVWEALRRAHLAVVVGANPLGLEMELQEGGAPLSAGQKQLVALARALLRHSKVRGVCCLSKDITHVFFVCFVGSFRNVCQYNWLHGSFSLLDEHL